MSTCSDRFACHQRREAAQVVACPSCKASVGEPCRLKGRIKHAPHLTRVREASALREGKARSAVVGKEPKSDPSALPSE